MIWYRHWMEMRGGLCVAGVCIVILCLIFPIFVHGSTDWFAQSGRIVKELNVLAPQLSAIGPAHYLPWGVHVWTSAMAAVVVGIFLGGTGIRTNSLQPGQPSMYYTLTLPISRFDLIWTRFASACAAAYGLFAAMLVFNCIALLLMDRPVPLGLMAGSSFLAGLLAVPVLAVFGVLIPLWNEKVSGPVFLIAIGAAIKWAWEPIGFVGSLGMPWQPIGLLFLITGVALSGAAVLARHQDF